MVRWVQWQIILTLIEKRGTYWTIFQKKKNSLNVLWHTLMFQDDKHTQFVHMPAPKVHVTYTNNLCKHLVAIFVPKLNIASSNFQLYKSPLCIQKYISKLLIIKLHSEQIMEKHFKIFQRVGYCSCIISNICNTWVQM